MSENDLRYLLKEKYNYKESELFNINKIIKSSDLSSDIKQDIHSLKNGTPVAYLIGHVDFLNLKIDLKYKTLIPRPETEYWVDKYIFKIKENLIKKGQKHNHIGKSFIEKRKLLEIDNLNILDIFCGSGCIGLSFIKNLENINVVLSDISDEAVKQTKENLVINNINETKCEIIQSDLFENLKDKKFDYIFANPPYVENVYKDMGEKGLKYEPSIALFGGEDGLDIIRKFLKEVKSHLKPNGILVMEFGDKQEILITDILNKYGFTNFEFYKDQFGVFRWVEVKI